MPNNCAPWRFRAFPTPSGRPSPVFLMTLLPVLARENPTWGYRRVHGELASSRTRSRCFHSVEGLRAAGIDPRRDRTGPSWSEFIGSQAKAVIATDFARVDTTLLRRFHVLFVIEVATPTDLDHPSSPQPLRNQSTLPSSSVTAPATSHAPSAPWDLSDPDPTASHRKPTRSPNDGYGRSTTSSSIARSSGTNSSCGDPSSSTSSITTRTDLIAA